MLKKDNLNIGDDYETCASKNKFATSTHSGNLGKCEPYFSYEFPLDGKTRFFS